MIMPAVDKDRLLGTALLVLRHGRALQGLSGAPHGLILLTGPPGTGKSTLCQGLAQVAAKAVATRGATTLVEIDPHAFPSDLLGESQRAVRRLFTETIPELAARRPHTIVVVDEVEAFAVRRSTASFETNPVDVHRATDAVLAGLDEVRRDWPHVLLLCTTNFLTAVDEAFMSRADALIWTRLPDPASLAQIFGNTLRELAVLWPELADLAQDTELHRRLADLHAGADGRRAGKLVLETLGSRPDLAAEPRLLTREDLLAAASAEPVVAADLIRP
jgi:SpoVK/Ycf46/Vps4 family AAA+-type ATPase